jgi:hypothetical protein
MHHTSILKEIAPPQTYHERHRPEKTLLYRIIDRYSPEFRAYMSEQGRSLPNHVQKEYLKCGRLEDGFLSLQCSICHHERLVAFSRTNSRRHEANDAVSVPAEVPGAWPKVQPCWLTKSFLINTHTSPIR